MSGTTEIRAALITRLTAASPGAALGVTDVAWEGKKYTPTPGTRWYRETLIPGVPQARAVGDCAYNRFTGLFQIDVFDPPDTLDLTTATEAERIASCFKRGTVLTYSGVSVHCKRAYRGNVDQYDPAWNKVPTIIEWWADIANT